MNLNAVDIKGARHLSKFNRWRAVEVKMVECKAIWRLIECQFNCNIVKAVSFQHFIRLYIMLNNNCEKTVISSVKEYNSRRMWINQFVQWMILNQMRWKERSNYSWTFGHFNWTKIIKCVRVKFHAWVP